MSLYRWFRRHFVIFGGDKVSARNQQIKRMERAILGEQLGAHQAEHVLRETIKTARIVSAKYQPSPIAGAFVCRRGEG